MTAFSDAVDALTPLAYYRCEDASGNLTDTGGFGSHAVPGGAGTTIYLQPGADGKGIKVVGARYFDATLGAAIVDDLTIFAMVKRSASYTTFGNILSLGGATSGGQVRLNGGTYIIEVIRADSQHCASSSIAVPRDGKWHSVAVTKAATVAPIIYIDGVDVTAVSPADGTAWVTTTALKIGARGNGSDRYFSGVSGALIDEVFVKDAVLTAVEIADIDAEAINLIQEGGDDRRRRR